MNVLDPTVSTRMAAERNNIGFAAGNAFLPGSFFKICLRTRFYAYQRPKDTSVITIGCPSRPLRQILALASARIFAWQLSRLRAPGHFSLPKRQNPCYRCLTLPDMKRLICTAVLFATLCASHATIVIGPWNPLFKGIDHAVGNNYPSTTVTNNGVVFVDYALQFVHCLRINLTIPTVRWFRTPRATNYVAGSQETQSLMISNFVKKYGVAVVTHGNFYYPGGGFGPGVESVAAHVHGLLIS